ncbi:hypothetical protein TNCV_1587171 [Trichonephila clavipes]|nr:hypothetical protein TNCV_1587171 [Trichonephila clavipes]
MKQRKLCIDTNVTLDENSFLQATAKCEEQVAVKYLFLLAYKLDSTTLSPLCRDLLAPVSRWALSETSEVRIYGPVSSQECFFYAFSLVQRSC